MSNTFVDVATFQNASLALLLNEYGVISNLNTKFNEFNKIEAQLGSTITFQLPIRISGINNLNVIGSFQPVTQRFETLTVGTPETQYAVPFGVTASQLVLNAEQYLDYFGQSCTADLGTKIEGQIARDILKSTYRFYGSPSNPVNTYPKLAESIAMFNDYGSAKNNRKALLPNLSVSSIVASGVNQFVMDRNERIAESWMVGEFYNTQFIRSNLLPTHISGTVGNDNLTLTLTSIDPTGTLLTFSGASALGTVNEDDKLYFTDNVVGKPNLRYLTFIGYVPCGNPVQVRATSSVTADGLGNITIPVFPALIYDATGQNANRNLNHDISGGGFEAKILPDFKCGVIWSGDAWFLGMPALPEVTPFPTSTKADPETQISIRHYYGAQFGSNFYGYIQDAIWGSKLVPEYSMALIFPTTN